MIIPVKCFTCGKVLGDKYRFFKMKVASIKTQQNIDPKKVIYFNDLLKADGGGVDKSPEGITMDQLGLTKACCRRHMLTHVDID
jgi:DNA-directed RNA polymerase subunit N